MKRLLVVPHFVRVCAALLLAGALLSACRPRDRTAAALPGQLTKPIAQYSGDELYELTRRLAWGGGAERERRCQGNPACAGNPASRRILVRVDAVNGQDSLSALAVPTNGVVAVRALNRGDLAEARYQMKPGANFEYYLIVLPGTAQAGRWQLEELDTTPGARRHASVATGTFRPCNHPYRRGRVNQANFFSCADAHMIDSTQSTGQGAQQGQQGPGQTTGVVAFSIRPDPDAPIWGGCGQGCCVAE